MASVVLTQSLLTISSKMKSVRLKGNYSRLLPTTTSTAISSPSGFSSNFNWRIPHTAGMETKWKCINRDCNVNLDSATYLPPLTNLGNHRDPSSDASSANLNPDTPMYRWPTVEECNDTLDEMCLHDTNYQLYAVARSIFGKSKERRQGWMRLREIQEIERKSLRGKQEIERKKWIESNGRELGLP